MQIIIQQDKGPRVCISKKLTEEASAVICGQHWEW